MTVPLTRPAAKITPKVTAQVEGGEQVTAQVTAQVVECCREQPQPAKVIMAALDLRHWKTFQANYLLPLIEEGILERTIPDKPYSRLQKYCLTDKGRAILFKREER
ncbi:MAG TPA: hypothetical protein PLB62_01675 [Candidatus Sumerlaeota bacterium]|nr:hypothetical protein [Candidatus Sumerlaeota bacterium]